MRKYNLSAVVLLITVIIASSCVQTKKQSETVGPFLGNGFHNGWADQNSIVIWTRLTSSAEGNTQGAKFIDISKKQVQELNAKANAELIHDAQIPSGKSLKDMEGACPGVGGEVRLIYIATDTNKKTTINWTAVDSTKNYTKQWRLNNLNPTQNIKLSLKLEKIRIQKYLIVIQVDL